MRVKIGFAKGGKKIAFHEFNTAYITRESRRLETGAGATFNYGGFLLRSVSVISELGCVNVLNELIALFFLNLLPPHKFAGWFRECFKEPSLSLCVPDIALN